MMNGMADTADLQTQLSTNVKVLMAVHNLTATMLAKQLGWDLSVLSNRFRGRRAWKIEDLTELAAIFRVEPGALLGDTAKLVGAAGPARAASAAATTGTSTAPYVRSKGVSVGDSAHVLAPVIDLAERQRRREQQRVDVPHADASIRLIVRHVG